MMTGHDRKIVLAPERQRNQRAQPPIPQNDDGTVVRDVKLLENLVGGCQRFGKYRGLVRYRIGNRKQILVGQAQILREGAVAPKNPEHRALRAMTREAASTQAA